MSRKKAPRTLTADDVARFTGLLGFNRAWLDWTMYPSDLFHLQSMDYAKGDENAGEHFRYGAFQWWLAQPLDDDSLAKLILLTYLDADSAMAKAARDDIVRRFGDRVLRVTAFGF